MPPTNLSLPSVSTAGSSDPDLPPPGGLCAIHQPNLFPRLTTLAKLFAADYLPSRPPNGVSGNPHVR